MMPYCVITPQWFKHSVVEVGLSRDNQANTQIAKFMGPTWGPPGSCRLQMGPMLAHELCYQGTLAADLGLGLGLVSCHQQSCYRLRMIFVSLATIDSRTSIKMCKIVRPTTPLSLDAMKAVKATTFNTLTENNINNKMSARRHWKRHNYVKTLSQNHDFIIKLSPSGRF